MHKDLTELTDEELKKYYDLAVQDWGVVVQHLWDDECDRIQEEFSKRGIEYNV